MRVGCEARRQIWGVEHASNLEVRIYHSSYAGRLSPEDGHIPRQGEIHKEVFAIE